MDAGPGVLMTSPGFKPKVLVAKLGLDGHDVGARVVARGLVDAGLEVVYTGIRRTPEQVAAAARDEDVDAIGISILSGAHVSLLGRLNALLAEAGLDDVLVVVGGIIPDADVPTLKAAGVDAVFHPATTIAEIVDFLERNTGGRHDAGDV